ncbi:FxSxx-COOH system tetratricopeptide repeat protein [Actinomadura chibensis]|uniref:Tetratricopeptide repeat protein n=1 Tax=Actinomadura chibensis TaxID=392828 RepID=A0A5D0NZL6_9ACTN|nr:FxSxx-COOH system tetratricopeptide repeat protein [Actinomadura chibensis]TYB49529.1 tetratricopeptide repeat protein [Actinomadura chibensis]
MSARTQESFAVRAEDGEPRHRLDGGVGDTRSSPAVDLRTSGARAPGVGVNFGCVRTGDEITQVAVSLPAPESVRPAARVVGLPRPATPVFLGRHGDYQRLEQVLSVDDETVVVTQALFGMGGVGKSELALQYAHRARGRYEAVWWVTAENPQQVEAGLAGLTHHLVQDAARAATTEDAAAWAVGWLRAHPGWLLLLDNVTDPTHVAGLLGRLEGGHVLVTSRRDVRWPGTTRTLRLGLLDPDPAAELITTITGQRTPEDRRTAARIARELGCLPLALDQAAAYIRQTRITLGRYLGLLRRHPARCYAKAADGDKAQATIARLWDITLRTLREQAPRAAELVSVLAHYAPADVPRVILGGGDEEATEAADAALGVLASHSMIDLTGEVVAMHRLTRAAVLSKAQDTSEGRAESTARDRALTWLQAAMPDDPESDVTGWPVWRSLVAHVEAIVPAFASSRPSEQLSQVLDQTGLFLLAQGEYQRANALLTAAAAHAEEALGSGHPVVATRLRHLAATHRALGRAAEALPLEQRALAIAEAALGPDHHHVAIGLAHVAAAHRALGRPAEALPLDQRALTIAEAALGPGHPSVALALGNLAVTLRALGRWVETLPLERRALAIAEAALGPDHPDVAVGLGNLAATHRALGRAAEALPLEERALAVAEAALGPNHPDVATRLANLAATHRALGRAEEALPLFERALTITETALGREHPDIATRLGNLAAVHRALGRAAEALPLEERALAVAEAALGAEHPDVATRLGNLAAIHRDLGRAVESLAAIARAERCATAALGAQHPTTRSLRQYAAHLRDLFGVPD